MLKRMFTEGPPIRQRRLFHPRKTDACGRAERFQVVVHVEAETAPGGCQTDWRVADRGRTARLRGDVRQGYGPPGAQPSEGTLVNNVLVNNN